MGFFGFKKKNERILTYDVNGKLISDLTYDVNGKLISDTGLPAAIKSELPTVNMVPIPEPQFLIPKHINRPITQLHEQFTEVSSYCHTCKKCVKVDNATVEHKETIVKHDYVKGICKVCNNPISGLVCSDKKKKK